MEGEQKKTILKKNRRFIPGIGQGPFANPEFGWNKYSLIDLRGGCSGNYCLPAAVTSYCHFPWTVISNWKPTVDCSILQNCQWDIRLQANIFPYGGIAHRLIINGHIPGGVSAHTLTDVLSKLDPRLAPTPRVLKLGSETISSEELIDKFGSQVTSALFPETIWNISREHVYSILLLTSIESNSIEPTEEYRELAGLSRSIAHPEDLAPEILEQYKKTDYGLYTHDVCFIGRRGILAYLPDEDGNSKRRRGRKKVLRWLTTPAELNLLQSLIAEMFTEEIRKMQAELMRARFSLTARLSNFLKLSFVQPEPILFLNDIFHFSEGMPEGMKKLYYKISAASGTDKKLLTLRNLITDFVIESATWKPPVRSALEKIVSIAKVIFTAPK